MSDFSKKSHSNLKKSHSLSSEELTKITLDKLEETTTKLSELREKALDAYGRDHQGDILQYTGLWNSYRITLGADKAKLKALEKPEVSDSDSLKHFTRIYAKQNLDEMTIDFEMTQAKRAYEQRLEAAEQWLDNNFSPEEQMERLLAGKNYADCPIGNFEAVEQYYQAIK